MELSEILAVTGMITLVIGALTVVFASFRTNTAKVWKEEAEAWMAKANRLEEDLTEIKERLRIIQRDNERLLQLLTAISPDQLTNLHNTYHPPEV